VDSFDKDKSKFKDVFFSNVGEYLRQKRIEADLTQLEVAKTLGNYASSQFISNIERGIAFPPLKVLKGMVDLYKIDQDVFIEFLIGEKRKYYEQALFTDGAKRKRKKRAV
jgi:transcriptional regulator with XRE-family HTH domain